MWCCRLDGRKEIHDRLPGGLCRTTAAMSSIVPKFQKLVEARRRQELLYARHLYPRQSGLYEGHPATWLDLGFTELSMEPVVCCAG